MATRQLRLRIEFHQSTLPLYKGSMDMEPLPERKFFSKPQEKPSPTKSLASVDSQTKDLAIALSRLSLVRPSTPLKTSFKVHTHPGVTIREASRSVSRDMTLSSISVQSHDLTLHDGTKIRMPHQRLPLIN